MKANEAYLENPINTPCMKYNSCQCGEEQVLDCKESYRDQYKSAQYKISDKWLIIKKQ